MTTKPTPAPLPWPRSTTWVRDMAAKIRRVDFSPDEFLAGCIGLSATETGCYIRVLCLIYSRGGPVDDDAKWLAQVCEVHGHTWRAVRKRLIDLGKLRRLEPDAPGGCGRLMNNRAGIELQRAQDRFKASRNAWQKSVKVRSKHRQKSRESSKGNGLDQASARAHARANHQPSSYESSSSKRVGDAARAATRERGATPRAHPDSHDPDMKSLGDALRELGKAGPRLKGRKP